MPSPNPNYPAPAADESKDAFIDRCIAELMKVNSSLSKEEASNMAYAAWSKSKNARSLYDELLDRFVKIRAHLVSALGKRGEVLLDYTLVRLGVFDAEMKKFNMAALDGNMNLPYFKTDADGSITIGNLLSTPVAFSKIDTDAGTVEGYANTVAIDTYADVFLPEAYKDSFIQTYIVQKSPIYFMHHMDIDAGSLIEMKFDNVGMYVKTAPYPAYMDMIKQGKLKGFSIGFYFKIWPDVVGSAYVTHKKYSIYGNDISYVTTPANLLSYFSDTPEGDKQVANRTSTFVADKKGKLKERVMPKSAIKAELFDHYDDLALSQSLKMTGGNNLSVASGNNLNVANKPQKETKHLSQEQIKPKPKPEDEEADESETDVILSAEELMKLSPDEMMKYAEAQALRKIKLDMAAKITSQEKAIQEAKAEDKFKDIQTKFAQLIAKFDELATEVKTIAAKQAIHEQKMVKMESAPAETPASSTASAPQVNLLEQAQGCKSFSDFQLKISRNGVQ